MAGADEGMVTDLEDFATAVGAGADPGRRQVVGADLDFGKLGVEGGVDQG